ncbi:MAG: HPF/RaiA family ribosome-associated protein [bacterium]|nr:HPF/RaiA family ribosome-associated protein [bacterium]
MEITIRTKNLNLDQDLRDYVNEKIGETLEKLLIKEKTPLKAGVELIRVTKHHQKGMVFRTEVNLILHGHEIIAEAGAYTIKESIDQVKDELETEIKRHRGKEKDIRIRKERFFKKLLRFSPLTVFRKREGKN